MAKDGSPWTSQSRMLDGLSWVRMVKMAGSGGQSEQGPASDLVRSFILDLLDFIESLRTDAPTLAKWIPDSILAFPLAANQLESILQNYIDLLSLTATTDTKAGSPAPGVRLLSVLDQNGGRPANQIQTQSQMDYDADHKKNGKTDSVAGSMEPDHILDELLRDIVSSKK